MPSTTAAAVNDVLLWLLLRLALGLGDFTFEAAVAVTLADVALLVPLAEEVSEGSGTTTEACRMVVLLA